MKIYTKKGDLGKTSIIGETDIYKDNIRIEAYGTVDELNSYLGLLRSFDSINFKKQKEEIIYIQNCLFHIGASLASKKNINKSINKEDVINLEKFIDQTESNLDPLQSFILPGGGVWTGYAQISRSICRRVERRVVSLSSQESIDPIIIVFINRLSDYLFVLARYISRVNNVKEIKWNN